MISVRFLSILSLHTSSHICRQHEILGALRKTAEHPAIESIHLFVKSRRRLRRLTVALNTSLPAKIDAVIELGRMPLNSDFAKYASTVLKNRWVLVSNDDVYPEGGAWASTPPGALLLSRHAKRREVSACGQCDATRAQLFRSLCNDKNFGSFDAWVARFETELLDPIGVSLLHTPRHAFGADNLLGHVFETYFRLPLTNLCHSYRLYHVHCTFPTSVGNPRVADRGYGDRTFVTHGDMARLLRTYENITQERANRVVRRRWEAL